MLRGESKDSEVDDVAEGAQDRVQPNHLANGKGAIYPRIVIACPACGIRGDLHDSRQFEHMFTPLGGDPLYGCRECKSQLLLVPGMFTPKFHVVLSDGAAALAAQREHNESGGFPHVLTEAGKKSLRKLPYSTANPKHFGQLDTDWKAND